MAAKGGLFPTTSLTALGRARSSDESERRRAWLELAAVYYRPIYVHLRIKWARSRAEAEDLTQHFFVHAIEQDLLATYDPARGRFRNFVRVCTDHLVMNEHAARQALKRKANYLDLDFSDLETSLADREAIAPDRAFEEEWARSVLSESVSRLKEQLTAEGRAHQFEAFAR